MKNSVLKSLILLLFVSINLSSCTDDETGGDTLTLQREFVSAVTGPETGFINNPITLQVSFMADNACGSFNRFIETTAGNTKTIEVEAKYEGSQCATVLTSVVTPYTFNVIVPGTFTFRFKKSATEFIVHTVVVE